MGTSKKSACEGGGINPSVGGNTPYYEGALPPVFFRSNIIKGRIK